MFALNTAALTLVCALELSISTYTWGPNSTGDQLLYLNSPQSAQWPKSVFGAYNIYDDIK